MFRKTITFVIMLLMLFSLFVLPCSAYTLNETNASVGGYYLYNIENDLIMAEKNTDDIISPSSTVKIMTACIAMESETDMDKVITITKPMLEGITGRKMYLEAGDRMTFGDLLYATLCGGYNDAAQALAVSVGLTLDNFVDKMNEKAASLGMGNTHYSNVTGIHESSMVSTVADIAVLARYMASNQEFIDICATKSYKLSSYATCEQTVISNRSTILASYKGMSNFNTGSGNFGDCAVIYYTRSGLSYISVVMNTNPYDEDDDTNYAESYTKQLIYHAVNDYGLQTIIDSQTAIAELPVKYSIAGDDVKLFLKEDLELFLPNDIEPQKDLLYSTYIYGDELKAPLIADSVVGEMTVSYDGKILAKVDIIVSKNIEKNDFLYFMDIMQEYIKSRAFLITVVSFAVLLSIYYIRKRIKLEQMYNKRKKKSNNFKK